MISLIVLRKKNKICKTTQTSPHQPISDYHYQHVGDTSHAELTPCRQQEAKSGPHHLKHAQV